MKFALHSFIYFFAAALVAARMPARAQNIDARAKAIISRMTLQEKPDQLHGFRMPDHRRYVPPVPRLHIPAMLVTNGPAGAGPGDPPKQEPATALPAPISLAATWDTAAARLYGMIVGSESRDLGNSLVEGPDVNIARVPENGRTFEAFGEDPYLVGRIAAAEVEGIQSQHTIADVKHYDANNQETDRFRVNEIIGKRALHEIYLPAFEVAVRQANVAAVMCAYPKVNGEFNCQNDFLMKQTLFNGWGFQGFVTLDFGATHSTVPSAMAGLDLEMPTGKYFAAPMEQAVKSGQAPMPVINDTLVRRFRAMMKLGVFYRPPEHKVIPAKKDGAMARRLAEEGIVLLKKQGNLLPPSDADLQ